MVRSIYQATMERFEKNETDEELKMKNKADI